MSTEQPPNYDPSSDVKKHLTDLARGADNYRFAIVVLIPKDGNQSTSVSMAGVSNRLEAIGAMQTAVLEMHDHNASQARVRVPGPLVDMLGLERQ
jgi:hypothetical protein